MRFMGLCGMQMKLLIHSMILIKEVLLKRFEADTYTAIEEGISLNPILHSFPSCGEYQYGIERELIASFLD